MKKQIILSIIPMLFLVGCANAPEDPLPPAGESTYTVKLTADNSTLTKDDSSEAIQVELPSEEDAEVKYKFEITPPCYLNTKSSVANQIGVKPGASIKSVSTYTVEKIIVDFYGGKGVNFQVFNNVEKSDDPLAYHTSEIAPTDPNDNGTVYEYAINSTGWCLFNHTEYNKPSLYYISVVFKK